MNFFTYKYWQSGSRERQNSTRKVFVQSGNDKKKSGNDKKCDFSSTFKAEIIKMCSKITTAWPIVANELFKFLILQENFLTK